MTLSLRSSSLTWARSKLWNTLGHTGQATNYDLSWTANVWWIKEPRSWIPWSFIIMIHMFTSNLPRSTFIKALITIWNLIHGIELWRKALISFQLRCLQVQWIAYRQTSQVQLVRESRSSENEANESKKHRTQESWQAVLAMYPTSTLCSRRVQPNLTQSLHLQITKIHVHETTQWAIASTLMIYKELSIRRPSIDETQKPNLKSSSCDETSIGMIQRSKPS